MAKNVVNLTTQAVLFVGDIFLKYIKKTANNLFNVV